MHGLDVKGGDHLKLEKSPDQHDLFWTVHRQGLGSTSSLCNLLLTEHLGIK